MNRSLLSSIAPWLRPPAKAAGAATGSATSQAQSRGRRDRRHTDAPPLRWRWVVDVPRSGAENMALDHAVALNLEPGVGVVRIYGWRRPTVSFGRHELARGLYDPEAADREGVSFVRRPTGGRVVLHDHELTYAVVAPVRAWGGIRGAYRTINAGLVRALARLGVDAELAGPPEGREAPLSAGPCFQRPAEGEVVAGGQKVVGSAQARVGGALLQHGSLLLSGSQDPLARIGPDATAEAGARPTTLETLLGRIPRRETLVEALIEGLRSVLRGRWEEGRSTPDEWRSAMELVPKYQSYGWTWRR